ncbi:hypothetical protein [Tenacibaculum sp. SG-28]|uniref:hypothetical protein n=1 Tax=Tenacibaculum sp. SG-28 TaxID=754426 RepID=UPI000CF4D068|nr:hypothetical protein [Tenacibaculum sp. SG-28]PQJ23216.1 hypothetical protein BSU00_03035 [Tenacibaculum sp. SG-28]
MNFKKHITLLFLLVLFIPATIQTLHAFENHSHSVCMEDSEEQHFHEQEVDCCLPNFQFQPHSFAVRHNFLEPTILISEKEIAYTESILNKFVTNYKTSRAPPIVI